MNVANLELPWTGERYVPQVRGDVALEHLHRYAMASELAKKKRVLDLACGEGYGSNMLAKTAATVIGVDIDEASIIHAQKKYQRGNLSFQQGRCENIPLPNHSVDIVVSFETIEHTDKQEEMLAEIKRVLIPGGILIISSPDKREYSESPNHYNKFHVKELYAEEFYDLLARYFKYQKHFGQRILYGSTIIEFKKTTPFSGVYDFNQLPDNMIKQAKVPRAVYLITICSDITLPKATSSVCEQSLRESESWEEWARNINKMKEALAIQNKQLIEKEAIIAKLTQHLAEIKG